MGIEVDDDMLFSLSFADDQVIFAGDEEDAHYTLQKLNDEYLRWGLQINFETTKYMAVGGDSRQRIMEDGSVRKTCDKFKYLGAVIS